MDSPKIDALHGERIGASVEPDPRSLTIEVAVMNQLDRIGYLRSVGESWQEPLFHLRDLVVGLEDDEFWDGIPKTVKDSTGVPESTLNAYRLRGWDEVPCRSYIHRLPDGTEVEVPDPTPGELSAMLKIILALLARRGMTWRRKIRDHVPMVITDD